MSRAGRVRRDGRVDTVSKASRLSRASRASREDASRLVARLEQVPAEVGVERGGVEARWFERDDGTVDTPG